MSDDVSEYGLESADLSTGAAVPGDGDDVNEYGLGSPNTQTGEDAGRVGTDVPGDGDDVNEYGLGAPDTQTGEDAGRVGGGVDEGSGLAHGLGPSDGPYLGEASSEEEGVRYVDEGADDGVNGSVMQPGAVPESRDPLERDPFGNDTRSQDLP